MRTTRREQIEDLADTLASETSEKNINKIKGVLFKFFSLAEQKPTDTFAKSIFDNKSN